MAVKLDDIDALLGYDSETHSLKGLPSLAKPSALQPSPKELASPPTRIPSVNPQPDTQPPGQMPSVMPTAGTAQPTAGIPAIDTGSSPSLQKPQQGFWSKLGHGLEKGAEVAGDVLAPGVTAMIPGTQLNKELQQKQQWKQLGQQADIGFKQAETEKAKADVPFEQAQTKSLESKIPLEGDLTQSEINEHNAQASALLHPQAKTDFEAWQQQNPGKPIEDWIKLQQSGKPPTAEQDTARATQLRADQAAGKPLSPDDANWLKGHTQEKLTAPSFNVENATLTPLINPTTGEMLGTFNTKTGQMNPIRQPGAGSPLAGATTTAGAGVGNKQTEAFNKDYVNPAEQIERSYQMFQQAYKAIQSGDAKTGAEDMLLLSQHLATTFGQVKGSRMNRDLIQEHKNAIGLQDRIERFGNNLASGAQLSPDQRKEFGNLISNMRDLTWQMAAKEAQRNKQPINFLPGDARINMKDSKGTTRPVPGGRVQEYLDKGAQLAD